MATYNDTLAIVSERYADLVCLAQAHLNIDGNAENIWSLSLPAGFGDCLFAEGMLYRTNVDTVFDHGAAYSGIPFGCPMFVTNAAGVTMAPVDAAPYFWNTWGSPQGVSCHFSPDQMVWVAQSERLWMQLAQLGSGTGDTEDISFFGIFKRLRAPVM